MIRKNVRLTIIFSLILVTTLSLSTVVYPYVNRFLTNSVTKSAENPEMVNILNRKNNIISATRKINNEAIAAEVNGQKIPLRSVELLAQLGNEKGSVPREEVLDTLILTELYYLEAQERGLTISAIEAEEYARFTKNTFSIAENQEEMNELLNIIMDSLEMTEEEYWNWSITKYEKTLSVAKLREQIRDDGKFLELGETLIEKANIVKYID